MLANDGTYVLSDQAGVWAIIGRKEGCCKFFKTGLTSVPWGRHSILIQAAV
jgi:hypothetical protein